MYATVTSVKPLDGYKLLLEFGNIEKIVRVAHKNSLSG